MGKKKTVEKSEPVAPAPVDTKGDKKQKKPAQKQQKPVVNVKQQKGAGKTKQIKKNEKPSKPARQQPEVQPVEKKPKVAKKQETNVEIFTPDFYNRLDNFQTYYKEVLELKSSSSNGNLSDELGTVNTRVREALQEASSKILKEELVTLEEWIQGQQKRLREQISTVENCLEQSRKSLESTKAFSVDEIDGQLTLIQKRIDEKQAQLNHYGVLLTRSQGIYQEEQPQKVEAKQDHNNDNNDHNDEDQDLQLDLP